MGKRKILTVALVLVFGAVLIYLGLYEAGLSNVISTSVRLDRLYDVNFIMEKVPVGTLPSYMPRYKPVEVSDMRLYSGLFGMGEDYSEDDGAYYFTDTEGQLSVYKYISQLHYSANNRAGAGDMIDEETAIEKALAFFESKLLFISYEEAVVAFDGGKYDVMFINRLGNIKNYSFNNRVAMDCYGNILDMDYYYITYDKLGTSEIMSMKDAFKMLPVDLTVVRQPGKQNQPTPSPVDLKGCQLVYFYENSIVQPGYLFEGELAADGEETKSFLSYVKASVYS